MSIQEKIAQILIVDDTPKNIQILGQILSANGYKVIIANNGVQALKVTEKVLPDLILLDVMMPEMDGYETCRQLKNSERTAKIPIIFLTARSETNDIVKGFETGAVDYILKPFQTLELIARVKTHVENKILKENLESVVEKRTRELKKALQAIEESHSELIFRLGRAAEFRDNETGFHLRRMSHYSVVLAEAAGMNNEFIGMLLIASVIHDLGKIGIPDSILLKPDKLTPDEFDTMKKHCSLGAELLSGSESLMVQMAERIALSHHEKWDGTGYPNNLKGKEIPIEARIVAIADVFDALTSERPYKDEWPIQDAVELLQKEKGFHFDPELVDLFIDRMPVIEDIKEKFNRKHS